MAIPSRFLPSPDAWDLVLAADDDDTDPLTLRLVEDGSVAMWEGIDAPSLSSDQYVYREQAVQWRPLQGAGHSRRTPATTGAGPDGQIQSQGIAYGRNATFVVPGIALPAGELTQYDLPSEITGAANARLFDAADYGSDLWISTGTRYLLKIANGSDASSTQDFGAGYATGSLQVFDGKLYTCSGLTGTIREYNGSAWSSGASGTQATRMERVNWLPSNAIMEGSGGGTPADHLILTDDSEQGFWHVVSGNDPKVLANWIGDGGGGPIQVGDQAYLIQSVVSSGRTVWFAKQNGLHGFTETGRCVNLTPWMERSYDDSNGGVTLFYSDESRAIVFYAHTHGLVAVAVNGTQQETARFVQFGGKMPSDAPIYGRPRALAAHVDGIFVGYYSGGTSYVMRLILEPDGAMRWSGSECTIPGEEVTFLRVATPGGGSSSTGIPRLWIGTITGAGVPKLYWQALPRSGNPWTDYQEGLGHRFAQSWDVYLPRDDGDSTAPKVVRRYDVTARGVGDGNTVALSASADDGAYVTQGTLSDTGRASFLATTYQTGVWWNWRASVTNSETAPVVLETVQARMSVLPEQADVWTFKCNLSAGQGLGNDAEDTRDPFAVRARVKALQRRGPVQMRRSPLSRETLTVKVEPGFRLQAVRSRSTGETVVVLTITVSVLQEPGLYSLAIYGVDTYGSAVSS